MTIKRYRVDCGREQQVSIYRWTLKGARWSFASLVMYAGSVGPFFRGLRFALTDRYTGETLKQFEVV